MILAVCWAWVGGALFGGQTPPLSVEGWRRVGQDGRANGSLWPGGLSELLLQTLLGTPSTRRDYVGSSTVSFSDDTRTQGGQSGLLQARHPSTACSARMGSGLLSSSEALEGAICRAKMELGEGGKEGGWGSSLTLPLFPLLCSELSSALCQAKILLGEAFLNLQPVSLSLIQVLTDP